MYETAKKSRAANKAKAERLANRPIERVDSSDWTPPPLLNADVKTGMRPVSKQALKRGGKVHGDKAKARADRMARKAGGRVETKGEQPLVDRYVNRDLKKANDYRDGKKHEGALKRGGRAHKEGGGAMGSFKNKQTGKQITPAEVATSGFRDKSGNIPLPPRRDEAGKAGMKKGGFAKLAKGAKNARAKHAAGGKVHSDAAEDKAMIKSMVKPSALRSKKMDGGPMTPPNQDPRLSIVKPKAMEFGANMVTPGLKKGGRAAKAFGGPMMGGTMPTAAGTNVAPTAMAAPTTSAGTMPTMPTLPAQAMQRAQGRPFQGGTFMPPGLARRQAAQAAQDGLSGRPAWLTAGGTNLGGQTMPSQLFGGAGAPASMPPLSAEAASNVSVSANPIQQNPILGGIGPAVGQVMQPQIQQNPILGGIGPAVGQVMPSPSGTQLGALGGKSLFGAQIPNQPSAFNKGGRVGRTTGGRAKSKSKGKTNINIVIAQAPKGQPDQNAMPPMPPAGGAGLSQMPPMMPPAPPAGGPPPMAGKPPMPFKKGGRVSKVAHSYKDMTAGAGSGEGRLQKTDIAERMPKKAGGKVYRSYKDMDAGAGSGFGRLEKTEIESKKSRKG